MIANYLFVGLFVNATSEIWKETNEIV